MNKYFEVADSCWNVWHRVKSREELRPGKKVRVTADFSSTRWIGATGVISDDQRDTVDEHIRIKFDRCADDMNLLTRIHQWEYLEVKG